MGPRYMSTTFVNEQEEAENSPENNGDSPQSSILNDNQIPSSSSPKKSKRSIQKRVISVSMKDVEVSRSKGEMGTPPSDSWAWRKYGQKPIKGSPYPRAYYRCSSSKGCPARKQVERSRLDAKMLTITYSCEHNHPWPTTRSSTSNKFTSSNSSTSPNARTTANSQEYEEKEECHEKPKNSSLKVSEDSKTNDDEDKFGNLGEGALVNNYGLWFSDHFEYTSSTMLEYCPFTTTEERMMTDSDMDMAFTIREEDESFFADLGELPECSAVFRRKTMEREGEHRRVNLTPWCGTTT